MRPTWVEVSLTDLRNNFLAIQHRVGPGVVTCAVVKADAYGHGVIECARALQGSGATWLGVTSTEEGVRLREAGITGRILLMTGFWKSEEEAVVQYGLTPAVWEPWHIELLEIASRRLKRHTATPIHIKIDTGMARLGVQVAALSEFLQRITFSRQLHIEGLFSHFASAETLDAPDLDEQIERFNAVRKIASRSGITPRYWHLANSAAISSRPQTYNNMIRAGIALYGYPPHLRKREPSTIVASNGGLRATPALTWKARIISLREIPANQAVGYNGAFVTTRRTRMAVVPVGYADGLTRKLSSQGRTIIRNAYAPIIGNISMDITLVDVTDIPSATIGDEVILIGQSDNCSITAYEHAAIDGTIVYEVLCRISKRVPRLYQVASQKDSDILTKYCSNSAQEPSAYIAI